MKRKLAGCLMLASMLTTGAQALLVNTGLVGITEYNGWTGMSSAAAWGTGDAPVNAYDTYYLHSDDAGSGDAVFYRVSGSHFPAGSGMYSFMGTSEFSIEDYSPVADIETVIFTMKSSLYDGEWASVAPTLSYNGGTVDLGAADFVSSQTITTEYVAAIGSDVDYSVQSYQWDLSGLSGITDYTVTFTALTHVSLVSMQLESGDTFSVSPAVVPEPSTYALGIGVVVIGCAMLRRRKQKA